MSPATIEDANPVRVALMKLLKADAILSDFSSGVYYGKAPQPKATPYVIVMKMAGTPTWMFAGTPMRDEVFLVKGVGNANEAEAIDRRAQKLLNPEDVDLEIDGRQFQDCRFINEVDYEDTTDGERFQHVGAEYRIQSKELE